MESSLMQVMREFHIMRANQRCREEKAGDSGPSAKRRRGMRVDAPVARNIASKLHMREVSARGNCRFNTRRSEVRFRNFKPRSKLDAHDMEGADVKLCFLRKRSKIVEIVAAGDIVFGLTQTGVCTAFDRNTQKRICFLNTAPDEVIRSLFFNKSNNSLITVSVYREDNYSSLKCRSTPIEYIRRQQPDTGFALFETEVLSWPGFVEFDDVNSKVLTYSAKDKVYKVWDLVNYTLLYSIEDKSIQEIKISPGIMLLIYNRSECGTLVPLKVLSIDTGDVLKSLNHPLETGKKLEFIEQFNSRLLVKQEQGNLQIVDVCSGDCHEVPSTDFMTPTAFIFLYENQLFLTFRDHNVAVWNFKGELVTEFEDHVLWFPDCNTNNIYITSGQDTIVSYCKNKDSAQGSINISDILTGACLAKIANPSGENSSKAFEEGLEDITALYYNEELNEIYTGNKSGILHVWSN